MKHAAKTILYIMFVLLTLTGSFFFAPVNEVYADTSESATNANGLTITVSYPDPSTIKCNEAVNFTLSGSGGSGAYKYMLQCVYGYADGNKELITDLTRTSYLTDTVYPFTFMASGTYELWFYVIDTNDFTSTSKIGVTLTVSDPNCPSIETIADNVVAQCLQSCSTDYEKALWHHDWMVDNAQYDPILKKIMFSAYTPTVGEFVYCGAEGILVRGKGTCESYQRAYAMLLNRVNIENTRVIGNGHTWSCVKMDGEWYQIDATWDDDGYDSYTINGITYDIKHLYFGLTDEIMSTVHNQHTQDGSYPCISLTNNYYIKTGLIKNWSDPKAQTIQTNLDAGNYSFDIDIVNEYSSNVIYNLVAYDLNNRNWVCNEKAINLTATYTVGATNFYGTLHIEATPSITHTVSFDPNGGSLPEGASSTKTVGEGLIYGTLPVPVKSGYVFMGWGLETGETVSSSTVVAVAADHTLYAQWEEISLDIAIDNVVTGDIVYLDGKPVTVTKNGYVTAENENVTNAIIYTYNTTDLSDLHKVYPTGMDVYLIKLNGTSLTATKVSEFTNLLKYAGVSIRITGNKGIRFMTSIPTSTKNSLINSSYAGYKVMEYGTIMVWASSLTENEEPVLIKDTSGNYTASVGAKGRAYSRTDNINAIYKESGGTSTYTNTLVGDYTNPQCAADFATRPYIVLRPVNDTNGDNEIVLYGGTLYRSISYVAYQNKDAFTSGTSAYEYIWTLIRAGYGDIYDSEYKG
ncbi:MAG: InlB B-repeat-containing protein [Erysipelotrichaceae bacterium]|nr:InlB B-repeat-containing protein [Erysipelotrichaceae bacterium]